MQKLFGIKPSYLTLVEKGEYCLSVEKIIELSVKTGVSTDYILRGINHTLDREIKKSLKNFTEEQIEQILEMVKQLAIIMKKQKL